MCLSLAPELAGEPTVFHLRLLVGDSPDLWMRIAELIRDVCVTPAVATILRDDHGRTEVALEFRGLLDDMRMDMHRAVACLARDTGAVLYPECPPNALCDGHSV